MTETIGLIEQNLSEKKGMIRRLLDEQDNLVAALSKNFSLRLGLVKSIELQETELKSLYEMLNKCPAESNCCTNTKAPDDVLKTLSEAIRGIDHTFKPGY